MNCEEYQQIQQLRPVFIRLVQAGVLKIGDQEKSLQTILEQLLKTEGKLEANLKE